jgi:myo-inositol 2-dehydrogenase/D-chiro-inositol 1-dehydrogenase
MRALVVGSGRMARIRLAGLKEAGVAAVIASRNISHATALGAEFDAPVITLDDAKTVKPDLVFLCSATQHHADDVTKALSFRVPILCEKPLAVDSVSAQKAAGSARAQDIPLYVAFQRRFDAAFRDLRARVEGGELGVLYHLRSAHYDRYPSVREFIAQSGGHFKDMLVHDIDTVLWLTGSAVVRCSGYGSVRKWSDYRDFDDCDVATVVLTLSDGLVAVAQSTRHHPYGQDVRFEAVGSEGAYSVGLSEHTPIYSCDAGAGPFNVDPVQSFDERFRDAFALETSEFIRYASGADEGFDGCSADHAAEVLRVAEACETSWRIGNEVVLGEER